MIRGFQGSPTLNRRALFGLAVAAAAARELGAGRSQAQTPNLSSGLAPSPSFIPHRIARSGGSIYAREYPGEGPTLVMVHGFPDNLHIYDEITPMLAAAKRHVVVFDFMGFGDSDKPRDFTYNFDQQLADFDAVIQALELKQIVPVAHDAGGPTAINYALSDPSRIASMVLLNTFYADAPTLKFPELIELCADKDLQALAKAIISDPNKAQWLLTFQNAHFEAKAPPELKARFNTILQPVINQNFKDGAGPAFLQMTSDARREVAANDKRLGELATFKSSVKVVWGVQDPYLDAGVATNFASLFPSASYSPVDAGHWPQIDRPEIVAKLILGGLT